MSTYIPGSTDYIPPVQSYQPDLNYYSNVLQTKQSQYDITHKQLNSVYGTMLNSPMLRDSNIERRDQFFQMIDQDVKRITGLDLSKEENVNAAMNVFRPIYEDKYMVKDMTWTKQLQGQMHRAESFRNCIDPEKCGGQFWEDGVKALNYRAEEFRNSDDNTSLNFSAPAYTPFVNLTEKAIKAAKDAGFNISVDSKKGGYIVTDTNGNLLLNGADGKPGILPSYLVGLFKDDQKVMDVFRTKAYIARKDFSKINSGKYGSEDAAESAYLNKIISATVPALKKEAYASKKGYAELEDTKGVLESKIKSDGGLVKGSVEDTSYGLLTQLLASKPAADAHYDEVINTIDTAKNLQDVAALRQRADAIVAYGDFQATIWNAAKEYAMGTQKSEMKADPYSLASYNSSLSLKNTIASQDHDFDIWKKKEDYKNKGMAEQLFKLGIDPSLAGKLSPTEIKDILKRRGKDVKAADVAAFGPQGGEALTTGPEQNNTLHNQQAQRVIGNSGVFLKNIAEAMKASFDTLKNDSSADAGKKRNLLISRANEIFKNTGITGEQLLDGSRSIDDISTINEITSVKSAERAIDVSNDPTSYYWKGGIDSKLKAQTMKDRQIFSKMTALRYQGVSATLQSMISALPAKTGYDAANVDRESTALASLFDKNANLNDIDTAAKIYAEKAQKHYKPEVAGITPGYIKGGNGPAPGTIVRSSYVKAVEDFKNRYADLVKEFNAQYKGPILGGKGESNYEGGATGVEKAKSYDVNPAEDLSPQTQLATTVISGIEANLDNPGVAFYRGDIKDPEDIKNNETIQQFALNYLNNFKQNLGEKKKENTPSFTLKAQKVPAMKVDGDTYEAAYLYKFEPSPSAVKHIVGTKNYDPNADYSFTVKVPASADQSEFAAATQQTSTQQLMSIPGQSLTYEDPAQGALTLNRDKDGFYFTGYYKVFDTGTGTYYQEPVPLNRGRIPANLNADEAYNYMQQSLKAVNGQVETIVKAYLNKKNGGAKS